MDRHTADVFSRGGRLKIYLVGGFLRDLLLKRAGPDRDFIVKGLDTVFLQDLAKTLGGNCVMIGRRGLHRIILPKGVTLDFTPYRGNVRDDLALRDFTINAMAWSPEDGLIDMHNGMSDIYNAVIRMISQKNIESDPVRILRAYRLSAEISFRIEENTRNTLKLLANNINKAKTERITLEFIKLLCSGNPSSALLPAHEDGILSKILHITDKRLTHKLNVINKVIADFDDLLLNQRMKSLNEFPKHIDYKAYITLAHLFFGESEMSMLDLTKKMRKMIRKINEAGYYFNEGLILDNDHMYGLFKRADDYSLEFLVVRGLTGHLSLLNRYLSIKKRSLLTSEEVMDISGVRNGKELGDMLDSLKRAQYSKIISNREMAVSFVRNINK